MFLLSLFNSEIKWYAIFFFFFKQTNFNLIWTNALHCIVLQFFGPHYITQNTALHCNALHFFHCIVLHSPAYCTTLHFTVVQCIAVQCSAAQCSAIQCSAVQCSILNCTALHCTALNCTALHCTPLLCPPHDHQFTSLKQCSFDFLI